MPKLEKRQLVESLEKWGTGSMTPTEIGELRKMFGDRAQELLNYYNF